jgi:mannan endo-1,4-beta-mannosidase
MIVNSYKHIGVCFLIYLLATNKISVAQIHTSLYVQGRALKGINNDTIIMKGVNYPVYNYGYTPTENFFTEIAKTKANAVRIIWYKNSALPAYNANLVLLDSAFARCKRNKMIPIFVLQDETCNADVTSVTNLLPFYTSAAFKALEIKYRDCLIINIANEVGYYNWTSNPTNSLLLYKNTYTNAIQVLRNENIQVPIMIDAPDCGSNSDAFTSGTAQQIFNADALSNTIFSTHAYWASFANNDSATMAAKIQALVNTNLCTFFGEISNQQDGNISCEYQLNYKALLRILKTQKIGWLAWVWYGDICPNRQISNDGTFNNLGLFGQFLINDPQVGLLNNTITPLQFTNSLLIFETNETNENNIIIKQIKAFPNPTNNDVFINVPSRLGQYNIAVTNLSLGQKIMQYNNSPNKLSFKKLPIGFYVIHIFNNNFSTNRLILKN